MIALLKSSVRHNSKLCDAPTDSDSDTSSEEEQPDADASTNAVVATVGTPASDMNDCEVCLVSQRDARIALLPCDNQRFVNEVERQGLDVPSTVILRLSWRSVAIRYADAL